jgi:hypothetical protein
LNHVIYNDIQFLWNKNFGIAKEKMPATVEDVIGLYSLICEEEEISFLVVI